MPIERISDLQAFVAVVEQGSLTGAAQRLGRSIQSVSRSLAAVERALGVELVRRTTRRSHPTDAGAALYRRVSAAMAEIEEASLEAAGGRERALGVLRISASNLFAPDFVVPAVAAFLADNPSVEVELDLADHYVDLVSGGYDVAIRIGPMPDSSLKARRLTRLRRVTVASPAYLARHGVPRHPRELADHACILRTAARDGGAWPFRIDGQVETVAVRGRYRTSGAETANRAAVLGLGVANAPLWQVRHLIDSGALEVVLTSYEPPEVPVHAVWPATARPPAKTQIFVDLLARRLKSERL